MYWSTNEGVCYKVLDQNNQTLAKECNAILWAKEINHSSYEIKSKVMENHDSCKLISCLLSDRPSCFSGLKALAAKLKKVAEQYGKLMGWSMFLWFQYVTNDMTYLQP